MNQKISAAILSRVAAGSTIREAIDEVLGAGTSSAVISDIYAALRARK